MGRGGRDGRHWWWRGFERRKRGRLTFGAGCGVAVAVECAKAPFGELCWLAEWRGLELAPLRVEGAVRQSQTEGFSFQPRPAKPERIAALLADGR